VPELALDSTFAGCRIDGIAGRGGMGIVYRATQLPLGRSVALKVVAPERAADPTFHARFERETRLAAALDHPNVIPVYEAGEREGRLYLVMRWVQGGDLQRLLAEAGGLGPARAVAIAGQAGAALDAAHAAGLVHRDVKPANVLLTDPAGGGHVYLTDFGLTLDTAADTRLTTSGEWIGTVDFMAPEQFEGPEVTPATDVYALGCVLHAALTGGAPFSRGTVAATMLAHLRDEPPAPSAAAGVPAAFDEVVARALAKRPEDRFASAGALVEAARAAAGSPAPARPVRPAPERAGGDAAPTSVMARTTTRLREPAPAPTARLSRTRGRRPRGAILAAAVLTAALAAAGAAVAVGSLEDDAGADPLAATEVRAAASAFASAYAREDDGALRRALTADVARVTPTDAQRGRRAVLREYRGQFDENATAGYRLRDLAVVVGGVGRASGRYVASRSGGDALTGRIALGVRREDGRARVALVVVTPD
jgi:serine/threonine-protein kinase